MKKFGPLIAVLLIGGVAGVLLWRFINQPAPKPPDPEQVQRNVDFKAEDFIATFDLNGDGRVTLEEFKQRYGKAPAEGQPVLIFHRDDGGPALTAEEAFARWDRDSNGIVDQADITLITDLAWVQFSEQAAAKGLRPARIGDRFFKLNAWQIPVFEGEKGALALKQLPFAGSYFDAKYFTRWVAVAAQDGKLHEGFALEQGDRLWLLTSDAKLTVHKLADVTVSHIEEAPQNDYARRIKATPYDDTALNLSLARQCMEWGLETEAKMLFGRVLVFDPRNKEALDAHGLVERDGHYFPKEQ